LILAGGKLAPHKALWPNFWGVLDNNNVTPIEISVVDKALGDMFDKLELTYNEGWPELTKEIIADALKALNKSAGGKAVYISAGKLYNLDDSGQLQEQEHHVAEPYLWPIAHNVRPAAQALGVRYCTDCHATDAPFFFGDVKIDSPIVDERQSFRTMTEFQDINPFYAWIFAFSFVFRPWMKLIVFCSCLILAGILLLYALKALGCIAKVLGGEK